MSDGIYTLANDAVVDQLIALINSIEVNAGIDFPVCVIAYDDRLDRVRAEIATRPQVMLLENSAVLQRWENFSRQVWQTHPTALQQWRSKGISDVYRLGCNRRYAHLIRMRHSIAFSISMPTRCCSMRQRCFFKA
jgi:hypothetical protein